MLEKNAVSIGRVNKYRSLAVAPIYSQDYFMEKVLMMDRAMQTDKFSIEGFGEVNRLRVKNDLEDKVFVVGGMTIEGQGQKRYSKFPCLIMPNTSIYLPVNCAEQRECNIGGRYGANSTIVMPSLRAGNVGQHDAWREINHTTQILGRMNPTISYCYADRNANVDDFLDVIGKSPRDGQVGIVAGIRDGDKTIYYTDFFGNHELLGEIYAKLSKSFGIVARVHEGDAENISTDDLVKFLRNFSVSEGHKKEHVGGGNLYLINKPVIGSALCYEGNPVQVTMRQKAEEN